LGDCDQAIGCGGGDLENLQALSVALARGDIEAFGAAARRGPHNLEFVAERNSLLIKGCRQQVLALLPVPEQMRWAAVVWSPLHSRWRMAATKGSRESPFVLKTADALIGATDQN
jgi:hypothetical protein